MFPLPKQFTWPLALTLLACAIPSAHAAPAAAPPPAAPAAPAPSAPPPSMRAPAPSDLPPPPPLPSVPRKPGPPGIAAIVNGQPITDAQVATSLLHLIDPRYAQQALQSVIANRLVDAQAKKNGIVVTPAELSARIAKYRQQAQTFPGGLDAYLQSHGETLIDFRGEITHQIEAEKLARKSQTAPIMVHTRHILILTKPVPNDPTAKPHTEAEAQALLAKAQADLKAGKLFAAVAQQYSDDAGTKNRGGDDGVISQNTPYVPEFIAAALKLKTGQTTVINSPTFGYFIIKADSTLADAIGAEKKLYPTADVLLRQQVIAYVQGLLQTAKVTNYLSP